MDHLFGVHGAQQRGQDTDPRPHLQKPDKREGKQPRRDAAHQNLHGDNRPQGV